MNPFKLKPLLRYDRSYSTPTRYSESPGYYYNRSISETNIPDYRYIIYLIFYISAQLPTINLIALIISEASLVKKAPELESTLMETLIKVMVNI